MNPKAPDFTYGKHTETTLEENANCAGNKYEERHIDNSDNSDNNDNNIVTIEAINCSESNHNKSKRKKRDFGEVERDYSVEEKIDKLSNKIDYLKNCNCESIIFKSTVKKLKLK